MARPRPIITYYDDGRVARSTDKHAAVKAAARRLLAGDYWHAAVYEDDKLVAQLVHATKDRTITITLARRYWK